MTESSGKGRPTPKRSDAQKRRTGPVSPPPATRREAAKRLREQQASGRKRLRDGTIAGDERAMLPRDAGPVRRLVRDTVDGRRSLGILLLPSAFILIVTQYTKQTTLFTVAVVLWVATIVAVVIDMTITARRIRGGIRRDFPGEVKVRGHVAYGLLRTTVFRRFRMPPARVGVGGAG